MRTFYIVSLGCPKNRVDSEVVAASLLDAGWNVANAPEEADLLVVNTCGFIEDARAESIDTILELSEIKKKHPGVKLVAMGCLSQYVSQQMEEQLPEIDHILGTGAVDRLTEILDSGRRTLIEGDKYVPSTAPNRVLSQSPAYAYLKVADGCSRSCSFCTIPLFKGPFESRPIDAIEQEARLLVEQGVKEVVLVAQDLTQFGAPGRRSLLRLLQRLEKVDGLAWIRLMYLYPEGISDSLLELVASGGKVVPYLDIPLQHVDDRILHLMKRATTERKIRDLLGKIRSNYPSIALRTTFIVGFPGEDESAFQRLEAAVTEFRFDHMGVFPYSLEPDTVSASLPGHLPAGTKTRRRNRLMSVQKKIALEIKSRLVGTVQKVLVEGTSAESELVHVGRLASQAPEVDGSVCLELFEGNPGDLVDARIVRAAEYDYVARPLDAEE